MAPLLALPNTKAPLAYIWSPSKYKLELSPVQFNCNTVPLLVEFCNTCADVPEYELLIKPVISKSPVTSTPPNTVSNTTPFRSYNLATPPATYNP